MSEHPSCNCAVERARLAGSADRLADLLERFERISKRYPLLFDADALNRAEEEKRRLRRAEEQQLANFTIISRN